MHDGLTRAISKDPPAIGESNGDFILIINPIAGKANPTRLTKAINRLEAANVSCQTFETGAAGDAKRLAQFAIEAVTPPTGILVAGGDGTINEVVNGMMEAAGGTRELPPLGIIPLGTANVLAGELGLETAEASLQAILARQVKEITLGICNGRYFTMMAGAGFDALVVAALKPMRKRQLGKTAYVYQSALEIIRHQKRLYTVECNGSKHQAAAVIVCNGHYYGGRFVLAPEARLDRHDLEIVLFQRPGKFNAFRYAAGMVLGRLQHYSDVKIIRAAAVQIEGQDGDPVQADGDIIAILPAEINVAPFKLPVFAQHC